MFNGGEDIDALVVDFGSSETRIGFAGEALPRYQHSTFVGVSGSNYHLELTRPEATLHRPIVNGLIKDWDAIEKLFEDAMSTLHIQSPEHPILLTEPSFNTRDARERFTELLFEKYDVPAVFVAKSAALSCYANGRATGLVIDLGAGQSNVVAVQDGYVQQKSVNKSSVGGMALDEYFFHLIQKNEPQRLKNIKSLTEMKQGKLSDSMIQHHRLDLMRQIKHANCRVSDVAFDSTSNAQIPKVPYELPDGTILDVGVERFLVPEALFVTKSSASDNDTTDAKPVNLIPHGENLPDHLSVQQMVQNVTNYCDVNLRRDLFHNVVLTGGSSCFENMPMRIEREVTAVAPPMFKVKIIAAHPPERILSAWLGGSILASLGSFHEMWISKSEYAEHGVSLVHRKCP